MVEDAISFVTGVSPPAQQNQTAGFFKQSGCRNMVQWCGKSAVNFALPILSCQFGMGHQVKLPP